MGRHRTQPKQSTLGQWMMNYNKRTDLELLVRGPAAAGEGAGGQRGQKGGGVLL